MEGEQIDQVGFPDLAGLAMRGVEKEKYIICWDKNGNVPSFFTYTAAKQDFFAKVKDVEAGSATAAEVTEELRAAMVHSMRTGRAFVINLEKKQPDFAGVYNTGAGEFPADLIFNYAEWRKYDNFTSILRNSEFYDLKETSNIFKLSPEFMIVFVCSSSSQADFDELCSKIPHSKDMYKCVVE